MAAIVWPIRQTVKFSLALFLTLTLSANPTIHKKAGAQRSQREHMSPSSCGAFAHSFPIPGAEMSGSERQTLLFLSANTKTVVELSRLIELWRHLRLHCGFCKCRRQWRRCFIIFSAATVFVFDLFHFHHIIHPCTCFFLTINDSFLCFGDTEMEMALLTPRSLVAAQHRCSVYDSPTGREY